MKVKKTKAKEKSRIEWVIEKEIFNYLTQLKFEYGKYVLYKKEHVILERNTQNQHELNEQMGKDYMVLFAEVKERADSFQKWLIGLCVELPGNAFQSTELAREAGVKEKELMGLMKELDEFSFKSGADGV